MTLREVDYKTFKWEPEVLHLMIMGVYVGSNTDIMYICEKMNENANIQPVVVYLKNGRSMNDVKKAISKQLCDGVYMWDTMQAVHVLEPTSGPIRYRVVIITCTTDLLGFINMRNYTIKAINGVSRHSIYTEAMNRHQNMYRRTKVSVGLLGVAGVASLAGNLWQKRKHFNLQQKHYSLEKDKKSLMNQLNKQLN